MVRRRDFLTGAAALGALAVMEGAKALTPSQQLLLLGGAGMPPTPPSYTPSLDFSDARNSQYTSVVGF